MPKLSFMHNSAFTRSTRFLLRLSVQVFPIIEKIRSTCALLIGTDRILPTRFGSSVKTSEENIFIHFLSVGKMSDLVEG